MRVAAVMVWAARVLLGTTIPAGMNHFAILIPAFALAPFGSGTGLTRALTRSRFRARIFFGIGFEAAWFAFVHGMSAALFVPREFTHSGWLTCGNLHNVSVRPARLPG